MTAYWWGIDDVSSDVCSYDLWLGIAGSGCLPMGFYQNRIWPCLIHLTMRHQNLVPYRQRVISAAEGRILEVGVGSGLNLPFYSDKAGHVVALDPSSRLLDRAQKERGCARCPVDLLEGSADAIPLQDRRVDTVDRKSVV